MNTDEYLKLARTNLLAFILYMFPEYEIAPHHRLICEAVQKVLDTPNSRLMISMPPRHGKSMIVSEFLPAFLFGYTPFECKEHIIAASYGSSLAIGFGKKVRRLIESKEYKALFPDTNILGSGDAGSYFEFADGSEYFAVGRSGPTTGKSSTLSILDDMLKDSQEAKSPTVLSGLHEWYDSTLSTRSLPGGRIIIMSTRWSEQDLQGYLLQKEPEVWDVLNIPALCEDASTDLLGRKQGEALWPSWYPKEKLERIKARNSYQFSALYQGNPVAKSGNMFNMADIKLGLAPSKFDCKILCWDTASTIKDSSCFTAGVLVGISGNKAYLLDFIHERVKFPALLNLIKSKFNEHKPDYLLIEDASSGTQILQILETDIKYAKHLVAINKKGSKDAKIDKLLYALANSLLTFVIEPDELIKEFRAYPYGNHDDGIIALGHAITWWLTKTKVLTIPIKPKVNISMMMQKSKCSKRRKLKYGNY